MINALISPKPNTLPKGKEVNLSGEILGANWWCDCICPAGVSQGEVGRRLAKAFEMAVSQMSYWCTASTLCKFNSSPEGIPFPVEKEFYEVLEKTLKVSEISEGALDPSLGTVKGAKGVDPASHYAEKSDYYSSWTDLYLERRTQSIIRYSPLVLDLSSVIKGAAIDIASKELESVGVYHYLLGVGSEYKGRGYKKDYTPWKVSVNPYEEGRPCPVTMVTLDNDAVATSGMFEDEGLRSHMLHEEIPSLWSGSLRAVTVIHASCMEADAYSSALYAMGLEKGMACANQRQINAMFYVMENKGASVLYSKSYHKRF